jgi:5-methylcytosine-specific restriction endonuclease McrA
MPIRPEWRHFYRGPAWRAIRARILARAGDCCERCAAPDRTTVLRLYGWWTPSGLEATVAQQGGCINGTDLIVLPWRHAGQAATEACFPSVKYEGRWVRIVLTVAHLNHDPRDNRDENLQALCQWCHLHHDVRFHHANARRTRARKSGQHWFDGMEATTA